MDFFGVMLAEEYGTDAWLVGWLVGCPAHVVGGVILEFEACICDRAAAQHLAALRVRLETPQTQRNKASNGFGHQ